MHRIPFDKFRPVGNKVAAVGAELWHTAANQENRLFNSFRVTSQWSPLPESIQHATSSHFIPAVPPSSPRIRTGVSQGDPSRATSFLLFARHPAREGMWGRGDKLLTSTAQCFLNRRAPHPCWGKNASGNHANMVIIISPSILRHTSKALL